MIIQEAPNLWRSQANRNAKKVSCIGHENLTAIEKRAKIRSASSMVFTELIRAN
jgi:hypothetical protein